MTAQRTQCYRWRCRRWTLWILALGLLGSAVHAQSEGPPIPGASTQKPPRAGPPWAHELPGYWASLITENWRLRMVTPPRGDYVGVPLTAAAKARADAWNPADDSANGEQCRGYGAPAIMYRPEHLKLEWLENDRTLRMNIDAGEQVRLFQFGDRAPGADATPSWQGSSQAVWVARRGPGAPVGVDALYLQVTTIGLRPGYLRQNGIPYSANAVLREAYDLIRLSDQESYLIVTGTVTDPLYLDYPLVLSATFQKQRDGSGWDPAACSATW